MLNKEEVLKIINDLDFPKSEYIVISGASMVVQDAKKETSDIDISISAKLSKELSNKKYKYHLGMDGDKVYELDHIELFNKYFDSTSFVEIDGIRYATLESVLNLKKELNRKKDLKDIKNLDLLLCLKDNKRYEKELYDNGISLIAGVDEVGRGPLVGPVVAAAVILPKNFELKGLTDSKKLSEKKREYFDSYIKSNCISYGIGVVDNDVIDEVNIYEATKIAMVEAITNLNVVPEHILIDAMKLDIDIPVTAIIKGDLKSISISAASVIAKVYRDNLLKDLDLLHPEYDFKSNKGYPTKKHIDAINKYGILKEHRKTYGPVSDYINNIRYK